jgi:Domain of unknown function (DUF4350)
VRDANAMSNKKRLRRAIVFGICVVIVLNALAFALDQFGGARPGPPSSSYTTAPEGLAAYADLLARSGHPVVRLRDRLEDRVPPSDTTVVVLDPDKVAREEGGRLRSFVEAGGRLIAGGSLGASWLEELITEPPQWSATGIASAGPLVPGPEVSGIESVRTASLGTWSEAGSTLPLLGSEDGILATVASVGEGRAVFLADTSPLRNGLLAENDNAAFGLGLAGDRGRPVVFVESVHGYGSQTGLAAIPARWKWALGFLALAVLVYMLSRGRRLGPPQAEGRELPPPRSEYVDAVAGILMRARDPANVAGRVRQSIRNTLTGRANLPADAPAGEVENLARQWGLDEDEARAVAHPGHGETDLLLLGRALARLNNKGERSVREMDSVGS